MRGFLHTHSVSREQSIDPSDGQKVTLTKLVPRDIADLKDDKVWNDPEYLMKTLVPSIGAVRETPNGNLARTVFLKGSSGPKDRNGRAYGQLRIGQLIQGRTDPDPETGESRLWTMLVLEGSKQEKPAPAKTESKTEKAPQGESVQDAPGSTPEASVVSEEVAAL